MDQPLRLSKRFFKGHGHGNDYLVFREGSDWPVAKQTVNAVCDRWRGVGGDGIVALLSGDDSLEAREAPPPPFRLRMFNPDGSEFERSGNGLRILGAYLFSRGWVGIGAPFPIHVGGDEVLLEILGLEEGGQLQVAVEMGRAVFGMEAVGGGEGALEEGGGLRGPDGSLLDLQPVSVGNPHCVVLGPTWSEADLITLGPYLTSHIAFPRGTNVQFASVPEPGRVDILIWERGVGRTASSGTSACAAAAACVQRRLLSPGRIEVGMEGGMFVVEVSPELTVRLEGPVQALMEGEMRAELLETLG